MRVPPMPQVCSGLLCGLLILITGCSNPSSQTLDSLTVTATPSSVPIGGAAVLKAVAHLSDGTTQDVTASTQWTLSNTALATISNSTLSAKVSGTVTVQAAYVEATPAGSSPSAATASPQNLSASTQVTITTPGGGDDHCSHDHLECAGGNLIRHSIGQYAVERDGQRGGNLRLYTGGRDRAESGKADAFRNLHSVRFQNLFCGDRLGTANS
jgi:hypothetical protein